MFSGFFGYLAPPPNAASVTKATPEKHKMEFPITYPMMINGIPITAKIIRRMVTFIQNIIIGTHKATKTNARIIPKIASVQDIPPTKEQINGKIISIRI